MGGTTLPVQWRGQNESDDHIHLGGRCEISTGQGTMRVSKRERTNIFEEGEVWESFPEEMMTDLGSEG